MYQSGDHHKTLKQAIENYEVNLFFTRSSEVIFFFVDFALIFSKSTESDL